MLELPNHLYGWMAATDPARILRMHRDNGWLGTHLPEVDALYGVPQPAEHHPEVDTGRHIELALEVAASLSPEPAVRFAVLVHDLGKALTPVSAWPSHVDHETRGVAVVQAVCDRFAVPHAWRELGVLCTRYHLHAHRALAMSARGVVRFFVDSGLLQRPALLQPFLLACEADARGREGLRDRNRARRCRAVWCILRHVCSP